MALSIAAAAGESERLELVAGSDILPERREAFKDTWGGGAVYENYMYVDREYSLETAEAIRGAKVWRTAEYEHNGLRADGARVLDHLLGMLRS